MRHEQTKQTTPSPRTRCAIYTRKSTEEGLNSEFNSLDAQREAAEAYILSQRHEGWEVLPGQYADGGFSGGNLERPGLQRLLEEVEAGQIECVVVHRLDRLSRSLLDFVKLIELFERKGVSFVSVTQRFDTSTSMGRLMLNILLSFAQFERELIGERIRDKIATTRRKGKYVGGPPVLGYDVDRDRKRLVVNPQEAELVRAIFTRFAESGSTTKLAEQLSAEGRTTKSWITKKGVTRPGLPWDRAHLYRVLHNPLYLGEVTHRGQRYPGEHEAIISRELWDRAHALLAKHHRLRGARTRTKTPALLRGLIRCGHCGCAMGPTYAKRRGKEYRYYLCVKAAKHGHRTCPTRSLAAGEIEATVIGQVRAVLRAPDAWAGSCRGTGPAGAVPERALVEAAGGLDRRWGHLSPGDQERIVQRVVEQVEVYRDRAEVRISAEELGSLLAELRPRLGGGQEVVA